MYNVDTGKFIPTLAYKIHEENQRGLNKVNINLKGLAIGGGFFEAEIQDKFSDYNYYLGFIDEKEWIQVKEREAMIADLIRNGNYEQARNV